ncbi:MAG: hypothetical protein BroJett024_36140 [Alphaproteobacteria bacterium]|nr:MAG: hypothetical protein BroJett024_36140 [Alphaproteobacteria bacterium]
MQVDESIRKCVVFLGQPAPHGFVGHGTGFSVVIDDGEHSFFYIISARHVVWPKWVGITNGMPDGPISVRVNRPKGAPRVFTVNRSDWIFHPDRTVDVCALPLNMVDAQGDLVEEETGHPDPVDWAHLHLPSIALTPEKAFHHAISIGEEVFITGAFVNRLGVQKNIPIVRIGNIAALPEEPIEFASPTRPAYLIETRSLGGISGSPVFVNLQPPYPRRREISFGPIAVIPSNDLTKRRETKIYPYRLLGMVIQIFGGRDPFDMVPEPRDELSDEDKRFALSDVEFNTGISVVMDINDILEFMDTEPMKKTREDVIEARRKQMGLRPASAERDPL